MGGRDRRWISQLVYAFYRLGHLWKASMPVRDRILAGLFLCEAQGNEILAAFRPEWNDKVNLPLAEKLAMVTFQGEAVTPGAIFPFADELSAGVDPQAFANAYFVQPHLFIRVRKQQQQAVTALLQQAGITYAWRTDDLLALPNGTKIETIIPHKDWYEIQDASSRETGRLFKPAAKQQWWDCCAASGGKSLLLLDTLPAVRLTVSDVRTSILENLADRFHAAGVSFDERKVLDLTQPVPKGTFSHSGFDGIILDAPCSGSGTWGRTPENLYFFEHKRIATFQSLQQRIATNVAPLLKPSGALIYITCSVFKQENEAVVKHICEQTGLQWQEGGLIPGYEHGADTMFAARLVK